MLIGKCIFLAIVSDNLAKDNLSSDQVLKHKNKEMKTLIIINEPFSQMALGTNTTLSYILSCVDLGHDVYIYNLVNSLPKKRAKVLHLTAEKELCKKLLQTHKAINNRIKICISGAEVSDFSRLKTQKVAEFLPQNIKLKFIELSDVNFVIQRLEPMKTPFPPVGKKNIDQILAELKKLFPKIAFNCPIGLGDKDLPQEINQILSKKISTPTAVFKLGDDEKMQSAISLAKKEYQKIYSAKNAKLVFKPNSSAQSLGVFSIDFVENGFDLKSLRAQKISDLKAVQNYQINQNLNQQDLNQVIKILCYVQNAKNDELVGEVDEKNLIKIAKELYCDQVLVQPFLQGVKSGDIRVNILKNSDGNFYVAGKCFRQSLRSDDRNFTTAFSTGGAVPRPISILQKAEIQNLKISVEALLKILNEELRKKYENVLELGADFILVGDDKNIFLGEVNHHCQGLLPLSEAVCEDEKNYADGLGLAKNLIQDFAKN